MATPFQHSTTLPHGPSARRDLWRENAVMRPMLPFVIGGFSGLCATICVQPLDMIKIRLQLSDQGVRDLGKSSSVTVVRSILQNERFLGFYQGLSAAIARQLVYGTSRLGLFVALEGYLKRQAQNGNSTYGFFQRALASVIAGGLGAAIGNPTEVALIRMQSDGLRPLQKRENFRSVGDAILRIVKAEGVRGLWSGCSPTIARAISTNFGQLAFFSEAKNQLERRTDWDPGTQRLTASAIGGFAAAAFSAPLDLVKSRLQSQQGLEVGGQQTRSTIRCLIDIARNEGLTRFYRGFPAYCLRMGPHS